MKHRIALLLLLLTYLFATAKNAGAQNWTTVNSNPQINSMFMLNSATGWAVGPFGMVRATTDGTNWSAPTYPTTNALIGVWAADATHVWVVGQSGTILFWNGSTWASQTSGTGITLNAVWGTDANHVWAVGTSGTVVFWNGSAWSTQTSGTANTLTAVWGVDATHVWAVGNAGTILFWNGSGWSAQTSGTTNTLNSVYASDANNAWAVSNSTPSVIQVWNGTVWASVTPVPSATYNGAYYSVRGLDASNVWLGGTNGTVIVWNGAAWNKQTTGTLSAANGMSAVSASAVWFTTSVGEISRWNGSTWASQTSALLNDLAGVSGSAANNIKATDNFSTGIKTFNGITWTSQSGIGGPFNGQFVLDGTHQWFVSAFGNNVLFWNGSFYSSVSSTLSSSISLQAVWAMDASNAWAAGSGGNIVKWNGTVWAAQTSGTTQTLRAIWGAAATNVWAAGVGGTILNWNGTAWAAQTSGTTQQLNGIWGADATHVWAVGASGTILFWNGTSWAAQTSGTTNSLNGIWGTTANDVYAVGVSGTILHWNGTAWSAQTSGTAQTLNGIWGLANGTVWAVGRGATILGAYLSATSPLASLEQPAGSGLVTGVGHVAYAATSVATAAGAKTFTIKNSGTAALTVASASVSGGNAADFTVNTTGMAASVAAGGSTTFTVNCTPSTSGSRSTTLSVVTGDILRSPITVTLDCTGIAVAPLITSPTVAAATNGAATLGGNVTSDGGAAITTRGVVISATATNANPTVGGSGVTNFTTGGTTGVFTVGASDLAQSTQYSYAAYATNGVGTTYTSVGTFTLKTPLSGTRTIGPTGSYATLGAASADITLSSLGGPLVLELQPSYVSTAETFPLTFSNLSTTAVNTLTIRPQAGATGLNITSADTTAATVDLNGAQFVTIDGRPGGTGTTKQLTVANTSTSGVAVRFINEASNNTLRHVTFTGANTSSTSGTVVFSTTTGANGNDNNTLDTCDLRDGATTPANALYSLGATGTAAQNNSGNTISNCNVFNFYHTAAVDTAGVRLDGGNTDWTISGNSFYQTVARAGQGAHVRAIYVNNVSGNNFIVTGNFVGGTAPNAGGAAWPGNTSISFSQFQGIRLNVGTSVSSSVQGNTVSNVVWKSTDSTSTLPGQWIGIYVVAGSVNMGTVSGNTIGSGTGTSSISIPASSTSAFAFGIGSSSSGTVAMANNVVGSITVNPSGTNSSPTLIGIQVTAGTNTISGNTVGSTTTANSLDVPSASTNVTFVEQVTGILSTSTTSTVIANNIVANLNSNYAGTVAGSQVRGIVTSAGVNTITGNTVRNLSTSGPVAGLGTGSSVLGISQSSATAGQTVSQNVIHSLSNTAASAGVKVTGIYYAGSTAGTNVIARNLMHSLSVASTSTSSGLRGMDFGSGAFTAQNNMVRIGLDASGASTGGAAGVYGIVDNNSNNGRNFYNNSIYVGGTETSGTDSTTACISLGVGNTRAFQNNIFVNTRSNNGGGNGFHYAVSYSGTGVSPAGLIASNNIFFVNTGSAMGFYNGVLQTTIAAWQTATGVDAAGMLANPLFINPTGAAAAVDLHVQGTSPAIGAGAVGLGVTDDFDGMARDLNAATIGADALPSSNANLAGLTLSVGGLSPGFAANTLIYTASVANSTGTLTFTPALSSGLASVTVNGGSAATPVALSVGSSNVASITVTAQDGTMKTYTVTVTRRTVFQDWALANGVSSDPGVNGTNGTVNLNNFAFGIDPNFGTASSLLFNGTFGAGGTIGANGQPITMLEPIANGVDFRVLYVRRKDYVNAGLTYTVEFSPANLAPWTASTATPTVLADDGIYQIASVPFPPFISGKKARFFRVTTTLAP